MEPARGDHRPRHLHREEAGNGGGVTRVAKGLTAAQIDDFVHTYQRTRDTLGHDASHEPPPGPSTRLVEPGRLFSGIARVIATAHYDDGGRGIAAFRTWDRELQDLGQLEEPTALQWGSSVSRDPESRAIAREALRRLPAWLIDLHLTTGFRVRKACWAHGPAHWYFHPTQSGGALQCRGCLSRRNRSRGSVGGRDMRSTMWRHGEGVVLGLWLLAATAAHPVTLAWDPSAGATGYGLYYGLASRDYDTVLDTGPATRAVVDGLTVGLTYYFAVTAYIIPMRATIRMRYRRSSRPRIRHPRRSGSQPSERRHRPAQGGDDDPGGGVG